MPALLVAAVLAFAFQGLRPVWLVDEERYANIALEMDRSGDWLHPAIHHEHPHYAKPPLTYWVLAASMHLLGRSEWALRLPNAIAFLLTAVLAGWLGRCLAGTRLATGMLVYAAMLLPFAAASVVTTDTLLVLFETAAVAAFARYRWGGGGRGALRLMWLAFALAFLTKGPPGLLPLAAVVASVLAERSPVHGRALWDPVGVAAFCLVGLGWYVAVACADPALAGYFLREEVYGRIFTGVHHHNPGLAGLLQVYLPTALAGALPWWPLALARGGAAGRGRDDGRRRLLALWLLLPAAVFAAAQSRLPLYLLPLAVPLSVLLAARLEPGLGRRPLRRLLAVWCVGLLLVRAGSAVLPPAHDPKRLARALEAMAGSDLREVVFVDARRIQGVAFYTDAEVEVVSLDAHRAARHVRRQTIAGELAEPEAGRVFVVDAANAGALAQTARGLGYRAVSLGSLPGQVVYRILPRLPVAVR